MKRYTVIFFIILFGQVAHSQGESRFSIGFEFSPAYSYFKFSSNNEFSDKYVNEYSKPRFGFSSGIPLRLSMNNRLSVETGLYWVKRGTRYDCKYDSIPAPNYGDTIYLIRVDENLNYHYFEIPVILRLSLYKSNKIELYLRAGFAIDFLLTVTGNNYMYFTDSVKHYKGREDFQNFVKRVNYFAIGGFGINYELTKKISLGFSPYFSYMLNNQNIDNPEDTDNPNFHFYDIGFRIGTIYRF